MWPAGGLEAEELSQFLRFLFTQQPTDAIFFNQPPLITESHNLIKPTET
jgi:hypothetical protein